MNGSAANVGFEVVVGSDGTLSVPAEELARHGVHPGAHLRVVPEGAPVPPKRRSARGILADAVPPEAVDEMVRVLDEVKAERIAYLAAR
jgi:hypothetical protein